MINKEFFESAQSVADERGISVEDVYDNFSKGLVNSYKKIYGNTSCRVVINPEKNEILLFGVHKVVSELSEEPNPEEPAEMLLEDAKKIKASYKIGDIVEQKINIKDFGRTAIGAANSVYTQGVRTRQRELAYEHFKALENEMVIGTVTNITEKFVSLDLGMNVSTILPITELLPNDNFKMNDTVRVSIKRVEQTSKDPRITISRSDPGDRSKIALFSNDPHVDAIGSCVGEGGVRIREIVNALGGEMVDLYEWSEDPEELVSNALQPASVTQVIEIDEKNKTSKVVVPDEQLSLAIGKSGQNVRLAVQSCGWKIDIMPTSEAYQKGLILK